MTTIPDIRVSNTWVDLVALTGVAPAQVLVQPKGDNCIVQYGPTEPDADSKDGIQVSDAEILEVEAEPNIWIRTWSSGQVTRVHVAEFV